MDDDKILVADFIIDSYNQKNIALNTKCAYVTTLEHLSRYLGHKKSFKDDMTSQDVVEDFLNSFRRPLEADPDQRWINSFNTRATIVSKFFKWLTKCVKEVEWMEAKVSSMEKERGLTTSMREQLSTDDQNGH